MVVAFAELHARMSREHLRQLTHLLRPDLVRQRLHCPDVLDDDRNGLATIRSNSRRFPSRLPALAFPGGWLAADQALVVVGKCPVEVDAEVLLDELEQVRQRCVFAKAGNRLPHRVELADAALLWPCHKPSPEVGDGAI